MMKRVPWIATLGLGIAVPVWAATRPMLQEGKPTAAAPSKAEVGKPAPDFSLKGIDGKPYKLSDFKGKIVVLEWINHECPVVNRCYGANLMKDTLGKFKDKPVAWLAIDSNYFCEEKLDKIKEWTTSKKVEYPYLLDASGKVGQMYDAKTTPHMFIVDKQGVLAYAGAIDNDPNGTETNKKNYVAEAATSLLAGSTVATPTTKPYGCTVKYKPAAGG